MTVKLFSKLFGYSYDAVKTQTTVSRQKIVTLGTLLLIPVFLWTFSGFYLAHYVLEVSLFKSIITGLVLGTMIFFVDRSFIATPKVKGGKFLVAFRLAFALVSTILGSLTIDLVVFSGDLEEYREAKAVKLKTDVADEYYASHRQELDRVASERQEAEQRYLTLDDAHIAEMDGSYGTGKYGSGKVAAAKGEKAAAALEKWGVLDEDYQREQSKLRDESLVHAEEAVSKRGDALLSKVTDLHEFAMSTKESAFIFWLFFVFVFALEAYFIIYKSAVSETLFEKLLMSEEMIGETRMETLKRQREEMLRQDGLLGPRAEKMRRIAEDDGFKRKVG
ncbi:DUF4407 domain-containing protein [Algoriphagus chordae]|uniref:Uncharacterized protein DUF4407 n=1 Tax=Algoriphagus chordae TaxID=237019 RepID=A0A2W7R4W3_9BACT|nr:DUF4407 domain-containing protein [Algoriphagus chordae]PZX55534.1 uncharacterized protein DUF4407 [Algoriphagus chordae]